MSESVYAKPVSPRIILRPALATLVLHGLILFLMSANWLSSERDTVKIKPVPRVINARLVDISELQPKAAPKPKPAAKPKKICRTSPSRWQNPSPSPSRSRW